MPEIQSRSELRRQAIMRGEEMPTFLEDEPIVCKNMQELAAVAGVPIDDQIKILEQVIQDKKDNVNPQPGENREVRRFRIKMLEGKIKRLKQKRGK